MPKFNSRLSSSKRGYDSKWQKAREKYLADNPFCSDHMDRCVQVLAMVVDHKVPHRLGEAIESGDHQQIAKAQKLFWDQDNWQSLCKTCHDSHKQRLEKSGAVVGCDIDGLPIDNNHHWHR